MDNAQLDQVLNGDEKENEERKRKLEERYQIYNSKKNILKDPKLILTDLFATVSNRLEADPFITDKLHLKKRKDEGGCCGIY